jgi:hypothetical protein
MAVNPWTATSPNTRLALGSLRVIHHVPAWSLAIGVWDGNRALLIRWNGDPEHMMGNPVSHANLTWFVLPEDTHSAILAIISDPNQTSATEWLSGGEPVNWVNPISNRGSSLPRKKERLPRSWRGRRAA